MPCGLSRDKSDTHLSCDNADTHHLVRTQEVHRMLQRIASLQEIAAAAKVILYPPCLDLRGRPGASRGAGSAGAG